MIALWHVNGLDDTAMVAAKLVDAVAEPYDLGGNKVTITISAGASIYPQHGEDADALMKSADVALYEAKRSGKNTYRVAEETAGSVSDTGKAAP
jgi:diguanylate cyclase (GGDEF)-like protein